MDTHLFVLDIERRSMRAALVKLAEVFAGQEVSLTEECIAAQGNIPVITVRRGDGRTSCQFVAARESDRVRYLPGILRIAARDADRRR